MEAINQRVGELVKALGMNPTSFAKSIGKPQSSVAVIVDGRSKPGFEFMESICTQYPDLSRDWLMMGEGRMFRGDQESTAEPGSYLQEHLTKLEGNFALLLEQMKVISHQLESKDGQIASLQRMLETTLGSKTPDRSFLNGVSCEGRIVPLYPTIEKAVA